MAKRTQARSSEPAGAAAAVAVAVTTDIEQRIRERAYQLFEARGREPGHEVGDWLQAEAEILGTFPRLAA